MMSTSPSPKELSSVHPGGILLFWFTSFYLTRGEVTCIHACDFLIDDLVKPPLMTPSLVLRLSGIHPHLVIIELPLVKLHGSQPKCNRTFYLQQKWVCHTIVALLARKQLLAFMHLF